MARKAENQADVAQSIVRRLEAGETGSLSGQSGGGLAYTTYLMDGAILACTTPEDDAQILRVMVANGYLGAGDAQALAHDVEPGGLVGALYERVEEEAISQALYERFRENLYQFLGLRSRVEWEPLDAVFVDNIQVGHDSVALVEELAALHQSLAPLERDLSRVLVRGPTPPANEAEARFCELSAPRASVAEVLDRSPFETTRTLEVIARLLDAGVLAPEAPPRRRKVVPDPTAEPPPPAPVAAEDVELDEHTEEVPREPPPVPSPLAAGPPVPRAPSLLPAEMGDVDLAAFGDYENERANGQFTRAVLERVEVLDLDAPPPRRAPRPTEADTRNLVLEMEEADPKALLQGAISLNFQGKKLGEGDARHKLEVVNEVLATVVEALDDAKGAGSGVARMQVLLEGTPGHLAPLFLNVEIQAGGRLPVDRVLKNLRKRPTAEQRHFLNRALSDVMERSLLLANEALDQRRMERMLERIAGYQQRLGV